MKRLIPLLIFICLLTSVFSDTEMNKLPIVYSRYYDIKLFGIEKFHPFETSKYSKVYKYLQSELDLKPGNFYSPQKIDLKDLCKIHSQEYLDSLNKSDNIARIAELGLLNKFPPSVLKKKLLNPHLYAVSGTLLAANLALEYGWAINLSGGYHHAKYSSGGGFCYFADVPYAVVSLREKKPGIKVLIIDLDAHQGNGFESWFGEDPNIFFFDVFNAEIYPKDTEAKKFIDFPFPVKSKIKDEEYLHILNENLPKVISEVKPDIIFYIAGTDIYEHDSLGNLSITQEGIIKRDAFVFESALNQKVPIVMLLGGGYHKESSGIIGRSIVNLLSGTVLSRDIKKEFLGK